MVDVFTKAKRSEVMSGIRSRGNKGTELALAALFRRLGVTGWRRHVEVRIRGSCAPGFRVKPDFVFRRRRVAVFVDGCFWHGCRAHCKQPAGNRSFWRRKLAGNRARDRRVNLTLRAAGWRVLRVWEHALTRHGQKRLLARLESFLPVETHRMRR